MTIRPTRRIKDEDGNVLDILLDDAEFAQYEAEIAAFAATQEREAQAATDKAALLARLGLTAEEVKLLLS